MTNNTIPNVPRELTIERDVFGAMHIKLGDFDFIQIQYQHPYTDNASTKTLAERIAAILSAPSPAGVDGLNTDRNAAFKACPESGCDWGSFYLGWKARGEVEQAIIDGLRGEVGAQRVKTCTALKERNDASEERDQQAQRIGELEGLLQQSYQQVNSECQDWAKEYERRKEVQSERDSLIRMLREFAVGISKREMPTEQELNDWFDRIDSALSAGKEGG